MGHVLGPYALASITHLDQDGRGRLRHANRYHSSARRVTQGIADQVGQDALDLACVHPHGVDARLSAPFQAHTLFDRGRRESLDSI